MATLDTILNIEVKGTDSMVKLQTAIDKTAKDLKDLKKEGKQAGESQEQFNAKIVTAETKLKGLRGELTKGKTELIKNAKAVSDNSGSYNSLVKQNAKLSQELRKLSDPLGKNKKKFEELSGSIKSNTDKLKNMDAQMGRQQRNVGNYGSALGGLTKSFGLVATAVTGAIMVFKTNFSSRDNTALSRGTWIVHKITFISSFTISIKTSLDCDFLDKISVCPISFIEANLKDSLLMGHVTIALINPFLANSIAFKIASYANLAQFGFIFPISKLKSNFCDSKLSIKSLLVSTDSIVERLFIGILTLYFRNSSFKTLEDPKNINLLNSKLLFFKSFTINSGPTPAGSPIVIPISDFILKFNKIMFRWFYIYI